MVDKESIILGLVIWHADKTCHQRPLFCTKKIEFNRNNTNVATDKGAKRIFHHCHLVGHDGSISVAGRKIAHKACTSPNIWVVALIPINAIRR